MDEINEQTENMKQIQEALSTPIGSAADFDEVTIISCLLSLIRDGHIVCACCMCLLVAVQMLRQYLLLQDELEAELEELESSELEEQLLQPATTAPVAPVQVPAGRQPTHPVPQKRTAEEDELAALQAEMAL